MSRVEPCLYLDVDLSSETTTEYVVPEDWHALHLGGRGLAARILWHELRGDEGALDPANILLFATGPFQGTGLVGAGRHVVMSISPKTGAVADSYAGGYFGHELGRTPYCGIIIRGQATRPVALLVSPDGVRLREADDLWGCGTQHTETVLRDELPGARVASIGPAGESGIHMACIMHDRSRAAGRPGLGAVMGAKRLKAVAVVGDRHRIAKDPARFRREQLEFTRIFAGPAYKELGKLGTARLILANQELGLLPTENFRRGTFDRVHRISAERMASTVLVGRETCAGCPVRCKRVVQTKYNDADVLPEFGGPEYETLAAMGSLCLCDDLEAICLANQRCNDFGLDTISVGVTAAFLMEASEKRVAPRTYSWGDPDVLLNLIDDLANRRGLGELFAEGIDPVAAEWGVDFNMTVKGVEIPMHEPRGKQGLGISYATSPRGATHLEGTHDTMLEVDAPAPELGLRHGYDRFTLCDKPHVIRVFEDVRSFENTLILCAFISRSVGPDYRYDRIRSLLDAATGISLSAQGMVDVGARNYLLMRLHALRMRGDPLVDCLPRRFGSELPEGPSAGHAIDSHELADAIAAYYEDRGYTSSGVPKAETLRALALADLLSDLKADKS